MDGRFNLWLHLLGFATYFGATLAILLLSSPLPRAQTEPSRRRDLLAALLRIYDPLIIAALGVVLMTGAFGLTSYKAALRGEFFVRMGTPLIWKLGLSFILINLAAYTAFGIGHRVVRRADWNEPTDPAWLDSMLKRLRVTLVTALVLTALIVWVALRMTRAALQG